MTPYAILLVKPTDDDKTIRKAYHVFAEAHHPDANQGQAGPVWFIATKAYNEVKTEELRGAWESRQSILAGLCATCKGCGVTGTRMLKGKIKLCKDCGGEGRT